MAATDSKPSADPKSAAATTPVQQQPAAGVVDAECAVQAGGSDNGRNSSAGTSGPSARLFVAVLVSLVSPLLFGFCLSFTSPAQDTMLGKITLKEPKSDLAVLKNSGEASIFASVLTLGCMVGAFGGSALSDRIGRKWTLCLSATPMILSYGLLIVLENWMVLSALRFIMGIGVGAGSAVAPTYLNEVSTASLRGGLGASNQLSITIGVVLTNALGGYMFSVDGREAGEDVKGCQWRDLALCGFVAALILLLTSLIPESPKFHAKRGDMDKARAALYQLRRDSQKCQSELELLSRECPDQQGVAGLNALAPANGSGDVQQNSVETANNSCGSPQDSQSQLPQSIFAPEYRRSILAAVGALISQQLSGVNAIIFYTMPICKNAQLDDPKLASLGIMIVQVIFTFLSCFLMDRAGRKVWLLGGSFVMALSMFALMIYSGNTESLGGEFALGALVTYIIAFSLGWGPIPWLIQAELFPTCVRSAGTSIGVFGNWVAAFIVTLTFQPLNEKIGDVATFALFGCLIVVCAIFVFIFVPETRGKPAEVVMQELNGGRGRAQRGDARDVPLTTA